MSATTTSDNKYLRAHKDVLLGCVRNLVLEERTNAAIPFIWGDSFTLPTTSLDDNGDLRRLYLFPSGAYITDLRVTVDDMDSATTPTLTFQLLATDGSDTTKQTLVSTSTAAQAGGTVGIDTAAKGKFVGDYYLTWKTVAAAGTAVSGNAKIYVAYAIGINTYAAGGQYPLLTDAAI